LVASPTCEANIPSIKLTAMFDLSKSWIEAPCPICKMELDLQLVDVATNRTIICHNCKTSITLEDENAGATQVNDTMKQLEQQLKNLFK